MFLENIRGILAGSCPDRFFQALTCLVEAVLQVLALFSVVFFLEVLDQFNELSWCYSLRFLECLQGGLDVVVLVDGTS